MAVQRKTGRTVMVLPACFLCSVWVTAGKVSPSCSPALGAWLQMTSALPFASYEKNVSEKDAC